MPRNLENEMGEHNPNFKESTGILSVKAHNEFELNRGGRCLAVYPRPLERRVSLSRLDLGRTGTFR